MALSFIVIGDLFSPKDRGRYQGYISGVFGMSSVVGPTMGGFLTDSLSWRWVFFINIPIGMPLVALLLTYFPNIRPSLMKHRLDYLGVIALVLTVVPLMLALTWGGVEYAWDSVEVVGLLVFSAVMLAALIFIEMRAAKPIIPLSLFKDRGVSLSYLSIFFTGFAMFGAIIFVPLFFQGVLGKSATSSGSFLTPMMLGTVTGALPAAGAGWAVDYGGGGGAGGDAGQGHQLPAGGVLSNHYGLWNGNHLPYLHHRGAERGAV
ncbi:MAG: MFS transporter [SAR202 cluster bacterium]|nr:MFS transporter [SAR202 cluster bacterium]